MDETMNNEVVLTELPTVEEAKETSGPSKGFIGAIVGGIAAVAVGATIVIKRHKKKKKAKKNGKEEDEVVIEEVEEETEEK